VTSLEDIPDIEEGTLTVLKSAGLINIEDIIGKSAQELEEIEGMDTQMAEKLMKILSENVEVVEEEVIKTEEAKVHTEEHEDIEYYECPNCGAHITEDMKICSSCGVELEFKDEDNDG